MTANIDFYTNAMSRGRIVHWMMEELGEPYRTHWVDYGGPMKSPEYLAINPMGKVPALAHDGNVITECAAILTFLAASYPGKGLIPADSAALAKFYRWMFFTAGPVDQATSAKSMEWVVTEERKAMLGFGNLDDTMDAVESALSSADPWICGDQFTAVDVYLGSQIHWGLQFGTWDDRPRFKEYAERCGRRPALLRANEINERRIAETNQQAPDETDSDST